MKRDKNNAVRRLCFDAAALCAALAISYIEHLIPLGVIVPLPGIKLGLANLVVILVFCVISPMDAAVISVSRVLLSGILFGTPMSLVISLSGACAAYAGLCISCLIGGVRRFVSFIGVSVFCAALHSAGQLLAVAIFAGIGVFSYLPIMLVASCLTGSINGLILNAVYPRVAPLIENYKLKR